MESVKYYFHSQTIDYLKSCLRGITNHNQANNVISEISGIKDFFVRNEDYLAFQNLLSLRTLSVRDVDRREYGDFQTPDRLTEKVCSFLRPKQNPKVLVEPTFGKGSFILSALRHFNELTHVFGVEIYDEYLWYSKFRVLEYFIQNRNSNKPSIFLFQANVFDFDWTIVHKNIHGSLLVLGNPPWITNAELSSLDSKNTPEKSNFKKHKGFDAITGKGNFDIGEFVVLTMLKEFSNLHGTMAMLLKNSVIRNLVYDLRKTNYKISALNSFGFDAKKFFNASVEASLFTCEFNQPDSQFICATHDFSQPIRIEKTFGWVKDKFISNVDLYQASSNYDGVCPFEWRQGLKHDSSKVFELKRIGDKYRNGFNEEISIEEERVYGLVKSSDLKGGIFSKPRKYVIVTQDYLGQETVSMAEKYPKLYGYLWSKQNILNKRKSSIYANKPQFSIFGIGDYSFKPYKVAISGLYKHPLFTLLLPENGKPLMLDDTCYFLSFDELSDAVFAWLLLSDKHTLGLLECISFQDAKRPYTKDILMRVAIDKIASDSGFDLIFAKIQSLSQKLPSDFDYGDWERFLSLMARNKRHESQLALF